jgi:hypothetical protein
MEQIGLCKEEDSFLGYSAQDRTDGGRWVNLPQAPAT